MKAEKMQHFKTELEDKKLSLIQEISRLESTGIGDNLSETVSELSRYDNHPADLGSETFERSKDIALRDNAHVLLEAVEHALSKMKTDTYGQCDECGETIVLARLEALPWAALCIVCQKAADEHQNPTDRPLEEDALAPPFHRSFLDTAEFDYVGYDGEDALQDALKYGSSDTPQDIPGTYDYKALFPNSNEHQGIVEKADAIPDDYASQSSRRRNRLKTER